MRLGEVPSPPSYPNSRGGVGESYLGPFNTMSVEDEERDLTSLFSLTNIRCRFRRNITFSLVSFCLTCYIVVTKSCLSIGTYPSTRLTHIFW